MPPPILGSEPSCKRLIGICNEVGKPFSKFGSSRVTNVFDPECYRIKF